MATQCHELYVKLDLRGVDATNFVINFKYITKLVVENVEIEPRYSDRQELRLKFNHVGQLELSNLNVQDTLTIDAIDVKEFLIHNSTFAHVPPRGLEISRANLLDIRESKFLRISRKAIVVDKIKEVSVVGNEMTVNAFVVVYAKDGSHLVISCNRLLDQQPSTDCTTTTSTTTTTTTTTKVPTTTTTTRPAVYVDGRGAIGAPGTSEKTSSDKPESFVAAHMTEIIGGAVGGLLVITIILLVLILMRQRKRKEESSNGGGKALNGGIESGSGVGGGGLAPENGHGVGVGVGTGPSLMPVATEETPPDSPEHKETDSLLESTQEEEYDEDKPKFTSPIWLEEIQKNKIFNRQKSLLSEDRLADLACSMPPEPQPQPHPIPPPSLSPQRNAETLESVRENVVTGSPLPQPAFESVELVRLTPPSLPRNDDDGDSSDYEQLPDPPTPPPDRQRPPVAKHIPQAVSKDSVLDGQKQDEVAI